MVLVLSDKVTLGVIAFLVELIGIAGVFVYNKQSDKKKEIELAKALGGQQDPHSP